MSTSKPRIDIAVVRVYGSEQHSHFSNPRGHESIVESTWPRISAPVLLVTGAESEIYTAFSQSPGAFERRLALLPDVEHVQMPGAGHNMQHDRPAQLASLIERFLARE